MHDLSLHTDTTATSDNIYSSINALNQQLTYEKPSKQQQFNNQNNAIQSLLLQYNNTLQQYNHNKLLLNVLQHVCDKNENIDSNKSKQISDLITLVQTIQQYNITNNNNDTNINGSNNNVYGVTHQQLIDAYNTQHNTPNNNKLNVQHLRNNNNTTSHTTLSTDVLHNINNQLNNTIDKLHNTYNANNDELDIIPNNIDTQSSQALYELVKNTLNSNNNLLQNLSSKQTDNDTLKQQHVEQSVHLLQLQHRLSELLSTVQHNDHSIETQLLTHKITALSAKSERHKQQLLVETYNEQTTPILQTSYSNIQQRIQQLQKHRLSLQHKLHEYESCGMGYSDIVKKYATVQKQIQDKQEILKRFDT